MTGAVWAHAEGGRSPRVRWECAQALRHSVIHARSRCAVETARASAGEGDSSMKSREVFAVRGAVNRASSEGSGGRFRAAQVSAVNKISNYRRRRAGGCAGAADGVFNATQAMKRGANFPNAAVTATPWNTSSSPKRRCGGSCGSGFILTRRRGGARSNAGRLEAFSSRLGHRVYFRNLSRCGRRGVPWNSFREGSDRSGK